jgi:hypothetical protein
LISLSIKTGNQLVTPVNQAQIPQWSKKLQIKKTYKIHIDRAAPLENQWVTGNSTRASLKGSAMWTT